MCIGDVLIISILPLEFTLVFPFISILSLYYQNLYNDFFNFFGL